MTSPYGNLPARSFWRKAVSERSPLDPGDIYTPKFKIDRDMKVFTAGSCFAQHVGRALKGADFDVLDAEPVPSFVSDKVAQRFGYRLYSARYGNIYTTRQLRQLIEDCQAPAQADVVIWTKNDRFYDALRPNIEPDGLPSESLVKKHRIRHLQRVSWALKKTDLFVFTFGLTEAWADKETGRIFPTAPGTIAGDFDPAIYEFKNFKYQEILEDFLAVKEILAKINPKMKFMITTSPVPLTATATGKHVEVANSYSKSTLRAVCGEISETLDDVDYFPSYEIITSLNSRGAYFEPNLRSVSGKGVATAMGTFLTSHGLAGKSVKNKSAKVKRVNNNVVCEEELLESFIK